MTVVSEAKCRFCKQPVKMWNPPGFHDYYGCDCEICGAYFVSRRAMDGVLERERDSQGLLNCIAENISNNASYGDEITTSWHSRVEKNFPKIDSNITVKYVEDFLSIEINHAEKLTNLLFTLAKKAQRKSPFAWVKLTLKDLYSLKMQNADECLTWIRQLESLGYIESEIYHILEDYNIQEAMIRLTVNGWREVDIKQKGQSSKNVFIAMQFDWGDEHNGLRNQYIEAIKQGCADCGYEADIVSPHHTDYITDKIVAEIKASKFVIADFTFNNQGAYYEAGLARGLGKKVIHTVMEGHTDDASDKSKHLHFDIKQINYIKWSDPKILREMIRDRIKAVIEE